MCFTFYESFVHVFIALSGILDDVHFDENNHEEENVLNILSSYIDQSARCASTLPLQAQENIFEHITRLHKKEDKSLNHGDVSDEQEDNNSNIVNDHVQVIDPNVKNVTNQEQSDSNIINLHHEQHDNSLNNSYIANKELASDSGNAFSSPAAWRTRSRSKVQNKMFHQKGLFIDLIIVHYCHICLYVF